MSRMPCRETHYKEMVSAKHPDYEPEYLEKEGELKKLAFRRKSDGALIGN